MPPPGLRNCVSLGQPLPQLFFVPRAGGNLVQKQFMLLNDFLFQQSRAGCRSTREPRSLFRLNRRKLRSRAGPLNNSSQTLTKAPTGPRGEFAKLRFAWIGITPNKTCAPVGIRVGCDLPMSGRSLPQRRPAIYLRLLRSPQAAPRTKPVRRWKFCPKGGNRPQAGSRA